MSFQSSSFGAVSALIIALAGLIAGTVLICLSHEQIGTVVLVGALGHITGAAAVAGTSVTPSAPVPPPSS